MATVSARTRARIDHQHTEILRLYCQGKTQQQIGERLNLAQGNVSRHLREIREEWARVRLESDQHFEQERNEHLARLEALEATYWDAWERSCLPAEDTSEEEATDTLAIIGDTETSVQDASSVDNPLSTGTSICSGPGEPSLSPPPGTPVRRKRRKRQRMRDGNPAFLAGVEAVRDKIAKIKGLYASEVRKSKDTTDRQREYIRQALGNEHTRELLAQLTDAMGGMLPAAAAGAAAGVILGQQAVAGQEERRAEFPHVSCAALTDAHAPSVDNPLSTDPLTSLNASPAPGDAEQA